MNIDLVRSFEIFIENFDSFMYGVMMTVLFAIVGTVFGLFIGLLVSGIRAIKIEKTDSEAVKVIKKIAELIIRFYIFVFRGTPMMVQAIFFYYFFRDIFHWTHLEAGLVIIAINTGAYMAEIIRSGIGAIDKGQKEASRSLGLSNVQTLLYIILPQAIRNSFPSIGNQLIVNIKDSSMLNVLPITELFFQTTSIAGSNMQYIETYLITALLYLLLTSLASLALNLFERKMGLAKGHVEMCS